MVEEVYIPECQAINCIHILHLDGHMSHVSLAAILLCRENNIILICLPSHSSHIPQPLDQGVYCHVKKVWKAVLTKYCKNTKCKNLDKENFLPLLKQVYESGKCFTRLHSIAGFQYTELFPLNKKTKKSICISYL